MNNISNSLLHNDVGVQRKEEKREPILFTAKSMRNVE